MTTITYLAGSPERLVLRPVEPDGSEMDWAGLTFSVRIPTAQGCLILPATRAEDGFEVDLSQISLPARAYPATVFCDDGSGARPVADFVLLIERGC